MIAAETVRLIDEIAARAKTYEGPTGTTTAPDALAPIVVSCGLGTDSVAMLVWMKRQGIRPDAILFADTGVEMPHTYAYAEVLQEWLARVGFPALTIVRRTPVRVTYAPHHDLEGNCLTNATLPSLAFGFKSCSLKWKVEPMDAWVKAHVARIPGHKITRVIGYDASGKDLRRSKIAASPDFDYWYPLRDLGLTRPDLKDLLADEGLPQPFKSACFLCPARQRDEVLALAIAYPELIDRAIAIEKTWADGRFGPAARELEGKKASTVGLGRKWSWTDFVAEHASQIAGARAAAKRDPEVAAKWELEAREAGAECPLAMAVAA